MCVGKKAYKWPLERGHIREAGEHDLPIVLLVDRGYVVPLEPLCDSLLTIKTAHRYAHPAPLRGLLERSLINQDFNDKTPPVSR
jgi:hypothetical protein